MSALDFSKAEAGSNNMLMDLLDSFPSSTAVSSSPSVGAAAIEEQMLGEDFNQNLGLGSTGLSFLGHDIGCDFRNHSSSSERSSASPGMHFGQFNLHATMAPSSTTTMKNAGASSSPSFPSSEAESLHNSRASLKLAVNASQMSAAQFSGKSDSNKVLNRIMTPTSPLGDFRGYDPSDETDRNSGSEDVLWSGPDDMHCQYCRRPYRQPRLLYCLHSFCEDCIVAMLEGRPDAVDNELVMELEQPNAGTAKPPPGVVRCPVCKQDSNVGNDLRFVQLLTMDYVTMNMQEASAMEHAQLSCESCKAKEQAVAHCFDCSSFLCPNCVKAHQYMRCFENHKVLTFEEIKESGDGLMIHKPIFCQEHTGEHIRYFCISCKVPTCAKCLQTNHKAPDHLSEEVGPEIEKKLRNDLELLVKEGKQKVQVCEGASQDLNHKLSTVQERSETAVQAVEEAYNRYLEVLARRRDEMLQEIQKEHQRVEEEIMNTYSRIGNMSEKINDALSFTEKLLRCGNAIEILHTRKTVRDQLTCLIRGVPSTNVAINLRFISDAQQFEHAVKVNFGVVRTEIEPVPIEHVNVDELLKKINCANISSPQSETSMGVQNAAMHPYGTSAMGAGAFVSVGSTRNGTFGSQQQPFGDESAAYNNFSRIMAGAVSGGNDYYSRVNGHHVSGFGSERFPATTHSSSASVSPTSLITSMRPPSCMQLPMPNRSNSQSSPVDGGFGGMPNGGIGIGNSMYRGNHVGGAPNFSVPPPINVFSNPQRRASPTDSYDGNSGPLMGLPPVFGNVTVQTDGMMSSGTSGLTPPIRATQMTQMQTKSRFGALGQAQGQFNSPHGFCLNDSEEIAVADTNNHRIQVFTLNGDFRCQFGVAGKDEGQLWYPRKVAYLRGNGSSPGRYIVCDRGSERSRMQIFSRTGHFIKKIAIRYIDIVAGLAIDPEGRIVAVDSVTPTIFCIHESGELVRWFYCAEYMREPSDIAVSGQEYYVCDFKGHCVCVLSESGNFLRRIGCEGITNFPNGIDISDAGDVLIGDSHGNRFHVAVYRKSGELMCEFDCPYAKVSRCCGLRITQEGFIVTMAKNNHNVLVLNTLFVT